MTLPLGYQESAYSALVNGLPGRWFHQLETEESPLYPVLWGVAGALARVRVSYERALNASIPKLSGGPWLSLHLQSIGLERLQSETDEQAIARYEWEFKPTRNTRSGELAALAFFLNLQPPKIRLEGDRSIGRLGQFRIVVDAKDQPWKEVDYTFLGRFIRSYVSNGINPSVDIKLQCLLYQSLSAWQFHDQFPMSWNVQGAIWDRRAFISPVRLPFARNLIAQVSAAEWRSSQNRLHRLFEDGRVDAPGAMFVYLSDEGQCPYLLADYDLQLTTADLSKTFPPKPFQVDGFHFYDQLIRIAELESSDLLVPYLEVPAAPVVAPIVLPLLELNQIDPNFPSGQRRQEIALQYTGRDFSRLRIERFFEAGIADTAPEFTSERLELMRSGPWQLRLSEGLPEWGATPPGGSTMRGEVFATLNPSSVWWSDGGDLRSETSIWNGEAVHLCVEFLLEAQSSRTIRELELIVAGERVHYRRFSLPVRQINTGFLFKIRGSGVSELPPQPLLLLADGSVLSLEDGSSLALEQL